LCLTATLSKIARNDIAFEFDISPINIIIKDIIRPNLILNFEKVDDEEEKSVRLRSFLSKYNPKKTIAYLYSKKKCEEYAEEFSDAYRTDYYHADVEPEERSNVHKNFTQKEIDILFATTAFGMGINIPDIESVVHLQIPNSVEEYYQQVGRGWRKKTLFKECHCLALWSGVNFDRRRKEIIKQKYTVEQLHDAYRALIGGAKITTIGQVVNKDREALINSTYNLQLLKYKLEKLNIIRTIGEINGSPLTIELSKNTPLWNKILETANTGFDSFGYVSDELGISIESIMQHLFEQDLAGNIKKLPAMKKDIYFEVMVLKLDDSIAEQIVAEINTEVDFRAARLDDLKELFTCKNIAEKLIQFLS
jgi:ATP-dependent DNA helicase RecQ